MTWPALIEMLVLGLTSGCERAPAARSLFCAYGGVGVVPDPLPPGYETQFAVAVAEIESARETSGVTVSDFVLYDETGTPTKLARVVEIEQFERPRVASEGEFAYYLNPGGTRPWNGTLPAGTIRIRVRVALERAPIAPVRYRLVLGPYVIEGPIAGAWPS